MQLNAMCKTADIAVCPSWAHEQEGQLRIRTTVTLPELNDQRNTMEDLCSFRCQDFSDVRICQLGIRRKEDATSRWFELVLGVRGVAIHGYDPYMEKTIRQVISSQHLYIELVIPLSPHENLQQVWVTVATPQQDGVDKASKLFEDLPVLFENLPWHHFPRVLTAHRSEMKSAYGNRRMGREEIDFEFTGIMHRLEGQFEQRSEFPMGRVTYEQIWLLCLVHQQDHYECRALGGSADRVLQVTTLLAESTLFGQLFQDHLQACFPCHGVFYIAIGAHAEGQEDSNFVQVEVHVAMELALEDLHASVRTEGVADGPVNLVVKIMRACFA